MSAPHRTERARAEPGRARGLSVERGSALGAPPEPPVPGGNYRRTPPWRAFNSGCQLIDVRVGWDKLPKPLGLLVLIGVRNILRQQNLHDTSDQPAVDLPPLDPRAPETATTRRPDGSYNDLDHPRMGMAGARFGRNVALEHTRRPSDLEILTPNPRTVSRRLLTRTTFQPATSVNTLAAAWLQFMIHDWFSHGSGEAANPWRLLVEDGDDWDRGDLVVPRTAADPTRKPGPSKLPPTYINTRTHWWDGSSIYGSTAAEEAARRSGRDGKLRLTADGAIPLPSDDPAHDPTLEPGWWVGLAMLFTLFAREHNAICDRLKVDYPSWSDEELFQRARLVNAALLAKIHTAEWTPAIISHPTTVTALRANWFGIAGEQIARTFGRISASEVISGIPGAATEHYGVPYALTEEFTSVYRMHPLLPDDFDFRAPDGDRSLEQRTFRELAGPHSRDVLGRRSMGELFYSFGTSNPGAIVLRNYPRFLQEFERPDGKYSDLAATDILRSRELGVPRYNEFRRLMHLKAFRQFSELTDDPALAQEMREVYDDDIEQVDLTIGMFAERRPTGFAFSDTAFRVFVLMASRRLNSDRFFTRDFTPRVYTPAGMAWITDNGMTSVLLRHLPELRPALRSATNAFAPWQRTGPGEGRQ
ncbi:MAG: heme peroxidase [Actinomycetota bacterium]|nr:heme peroxidase [Actinomycetota bacterium]